MRKILYKYIIEIYSMPPIIERLWFTPKYSIGYKRDELTKYLKVENFYLPAFIFAILRLLGIRLEYIFIITFGIYFYLAYYRVQKYNEKLDF